MLIKAGGLNFDAFQDVTKQLIIWALKSKQGFHSTCENRYYFDKRQNFSKRRSKWHTEEFNLKKKEYDLDDLVKCKKDFYTPHTDVLNRSKEEIEEFYTKNEISTFGSLSKHCPPPIFSFNELDLPQQTVSVIKGLRYSSPTPVQSLTWPIALSGYNMVGVSHTGSGKTLGFALPGLIHASNQTAVAKNSGPIALVVAPTRELVQQIMKVVDPFAQSFGFKTSCAFGGAPKTLQYSKLKVAEVCVGTPGRLLNFLEESSLNLNKCTYCVLDEADRLLDMGFEPQIRAIMGQVRPDAQISMWSATWPKDVRNLASEFLKDYIGVKFGSSELTVNSNITQRIIVCDELEKMNHLFNILDEISQDPTNKALIFAQTKKGVDRIYRKLSSKGYRVEVLHGDLSQNRRDYALAAFRSGRSRLLLGTAVVGRGLDVTDIKHVINFDFPIVIEDYIHVVGRTGRNNKGTSHTFFTAGDARHAKDLIKLLRDSNQEVSEELLEMVNDRSSSYRNERGFKMNKGFRKFSYY